MSQLWVIIILSAILQMKQRENVPDVVDPILNLRSLHSCSSFSALNTNFGLLRSCRYQTAVCSIALVFAETNCVR